MKYTVEIKRLRKVTRHMWRICLGAWQLERRERKFQNTFKKRSLSLEDMREHGEPIPDPQA